ncbi:MAG TPA: DUF1304 domain-containing protein [Pseudomonadota bacterium]|nr:DUF1304 domain-containing protein [Pseudomonadota bacterium]HNO66953.1 DUF1304 domain-containing protein [Pseudomonadota bacterium]
MQLVGTLLVVLVAVEHLWFLILEMFLFRTPVGLETFQMSQQKADACATLAQNQGLYNGFLAAGLLTALLTKSALLRRFSLACVIVAGIYGCYSLGSQTVLLFQSGPALLALLITEAAQKRQSETGAR